MNPENQANRPDDINPNATAGSEYPEGVPHSGKMYGESPIREFDKTPLSADVVDPIPNDPERFIDGDLKEKKSKKGLIAGIIGGVAVIGVSVGAFIGINGDKDSENLPPASEPTVAAPTTPGEVEPTEVPTAAPAPSPTDIPTGSFESTPAPVETTTPSAQETESNVDYSITELREMPLKQFDKLPVTNRLVLVNDMLEYASERNPYKFGDGLGDPDTSQLYKFNPLDIASPENTAEEIAMQDLYMQQLALNQTQDISTSGIFAPEMAAKALSGAYINPTFPQTGADFMPTGTTNEYEGLVGIYQAMPTTTTSEYIQKINKARMIESNTITDKNGVERNAVRIEYTTPGIPDALGSTYPENIQLSVQKKFIYQTYEISGQEHGIWLCYEGGSFTNGYDK